jgi:hypothetical protein
MWVIESLNPGIHSLCAGGRVNVCGVPRQKAASCGKLVGVARVDPVSREPFDSGNVQIQFGFCPDSALDLFIQDVAFVLIKPFWKHPDDSIPLLTLERKEDHKRIR